MDAAHFHQAEHDRVARELIRLERMVNSVRLSPRERETLSTVAARYVADEAIQATRQRQAKWHETVWGRVGIAGGALGALLQIATFLKTFGVIG